MEQEKKKYANLFGNNTDISTSERYRVVTELEKIGSLTFKIDFDKGTFFRHWPEWPQNVKAEHQYMRLTQ